MDGGGWWKALRVMLGGVSFGVFFLERVLYGVSFYRLYFLVALFDNENQQSVPSASFFLKKSSLAIHV